MGISKIGPSEFFIKARVKLANQDRRKQERFRGTRAEAEERYLAMRAELRGGLAAAGPAKAFRDLLERYRQGRERGEIPSSQRPIYDDLARDLGPVDLRVLPSALERYGILLRQKVSRKTGRRLSNATVNRYRAMVAAALNMAVEAGQLKENPLDRGTWKKLGEKPRDRTLSPLEARNLLNTIDQVAPYLGPIVRFSLAVPSRKAELVNARREWLDMVTGVIRVPGRAAKGGRGSVKPIPPDLWDYFAGLPAGCPWLFYRVVGGEFRPLGDFKAAWRRCLALAGISDVRFHDTRHDAATALVSAGTNLKVVQAVGGWASMRMLDRYVSLSALTGQNLRDAVKFSPGVRPQGGNQGATVQEDEGKSGEFRTERAVS